MGRGARQNETASHWTDQHPDRRHWTPHQRALAGMMTREAYEGLYGRGAPGAPDPQPSSPFFPSAVRLFHDDYSPDHRIEIIAKMDVPPQTDFDEIRQDPVLGELFRAEQVRIKKEKEWFEDNCPGAGHWSRYAGNVENVWMEKVVRSWFWGRGDAVDGWAVAEDSLERARSVPSSFLAATLEYEPRMAERLADNMKSLRSNSALALQFFHETILPEARYLSSPDQNAGLQHILTPQLAREIWESVSLVAGANTNDITAHSAYLEEIITRGGGEAGSYLRVPIAPEDSLWNHEFAAGAKARYGEEVLPTSYLEAVHRLNWKRIGLGNATEEMNRVAEKVFVFQLLRVYYGPDASPEEMGAESPWPKYRKEQKKFWGKATGPLETLRPIFRGENQEELLDSLIEYYDDLSKVGEFDPPIALRLQNHFDLRRALGGTVSEEIFTALRPPGVYP